MYIKNNRSNLNIILSTSLLMLAANAFAKETPNLAKPNIVVPEQIAGVTTVTADQVIKILTSNNPPLLVDARI